MSFYKDILRITTGGFITQMVTVKPDRNNVMFQLTGNILTSNIKELCSSHICI